MLPFYALYLRENAGLRGSEVGAVVAAIPLAGILAQSVWGTLADRSGRRTRALVAIGLGGATGLLLLWRQHTFAGFLVVTAFYAFFVAALAPMAISVSLALLGRSGHGFGRVRAWGTLGYGCAVLGSHGRHGLRRWLLGSVAEQTVRYAPCSVVVVRGGEA